MNIVQSSLWERLFGSLLGKALEPTVDPLSSLVHILGGVMFGVLTIGLLILIGKYFIRWGYEEITIKRGKGSLDRRKAVSRPPTPLCEERKVVRRRRKPVPGIRRRT